MTKEEAVQVWEMLVAIYGVHPERQREIAGAWMTALMGLDCHDTMEVVSAMMKGLGPESTSLPTIVSLARDVKRVAAGRAVEARGEGFRCGLCFDVGWVMVEPTPEYLKRQQQMYGRDKVDGYAAGPCPRCETGRAVEFPMEARPMEARPIWGEEGFWRGRKWQVNDEDGSPTVEILPS